MHSALVAIKVVELLMRNVFDTSRCTGSASSIEDYLYSIYRNFVHKY